MDMARAKREDSDKLLVALERATHREVDFLQRLLAPLACRRFRQRGGSRNCADDRLEVMFLPQLELRHSTIGAVIPSVESGWGAG